MRETVELLFVDVHVRHHRRRIEHAETDASREEANECGIDGTFGEIPLLHGFDVGFVIVIVIHFGEVDALIVHAANQRDRRGLRLRRAVVVAVEDVADGVAVGDHIALEVPGAA